MSPFLLPSTLENRLQSCAECHLDENSAALLKKALKTNVEAKNPATNFVEVFKARRPQNFILGAELFSTEAQFFTRLAEKSCQEFEHWRMLQRGLVNLQTRTFQRLELIFLPNFFLKHKIHSILYIIFKIKIRKFQTVRL